MAKSKFILEMFQMICKDFLHRQAYEILFPSVHLYKLENEIHTRHSYHTYPATKQRRIDMGPLNQPKDEDKSA